MSLLNGGTTTNPTPPPPLPGPLVVMYLFLNSGLSYRTAKKGMLFGKKKRCLIVA